MEIVDEAGHTLPRGTEGIVRIANRGAVSSYLDDPELSSRVFRDGWFYPGDLGSLTADDILIISGRIDDVLNVGGGKFPAEKLEALLTSIPGVTEAAVFVETNKHGVEEVWAATVGPGKDECRNDPGLCRPRMPAAFVPANVATLDAIPLTAAGKIDRPRLKELVLKKGAQFSAGAHSHQSV